jgi:hypothetical protein
MKYIQNGTRQTATQTIARQQFLNLLPERCGFEREEYPTTDVFPSSETRNRVPQLHRLVPGSHSLSVSHKGHFTSMVFNSCGRRGILCFFRKYIIRPGKCKNKTTKKLVVPHIAAAEDRGNGADRFEFHGNFSVGVSVLACPGLVRGLFFGRLPANRTTTVLRSF